MNKHYIQSALLCTAICIASCGSESEVLAPEQYNQDSKVFLTFHAAYAGQDDTQAATSKTAIGAIDATNKKIGLRFTVGERIKVYTSGGEVAAFTNDIESGTATTCDFSGYVRETKGSYCAIMPFGADILENSITSTEASVKLPDKQNAVAGSFDPAAHIMVAYSNSDQFEFEFKTVNAFLKFTPPCDLNNVKLTANGGEAIAGYIKVTTEDNYKTFTVESAQTPVISSFVLNGTMKKDQTYYISIIPGTFSEGLTIGYTASDGKVASYTTKKFTIEPNHVKTLKAGEFVDISTDPISSEELKAHLQNCSENVVTKVYLKDYKNEYDSDIELYENGAIHEVLKNYPTKTVRLELPEGTKSIGEDAFTSLENLAGIKIPKSVVSIGNSAFQGCTNLADVEISEGVTSIGKMAFYACKSLESITIPQSVESIGALAFYGCTSLKSIEVDPGNTSFKSIDGVLFSNDGKTLICFPAGKKSYSYSIPEGVTSIGDYAFSQNSLCGITITGGVKSIGKSAFELSRNISYVEIPESVTSIGNNAFELCYRIDAITINGTPVIGDNVFLNDKLTVYVTTDTYNEYGVKGKKYAGIMYTGN